MATWGEHERQTFRTEQRHNPGTRHLMVSHTPHKDGVRRVVFAALLKRIRGSDGQRFPIGTERERRNACWVTGQLKKPLFIITVPDIHHAIATTRGKRAEDGMERDRIHRVNYILSINLARGIKCNSKQC